MKLEDVTKKELKALEQLKSKGYETTDLIQLTKALEQQGSTIHNEYRIGKSHVKYLLFGDTHIGNINYDSDLMKFAAKTADKEKVDFAIHTGDIMDGWYQNRPQSVFEQNAIGFDRQFNMATEELSQLNVPLYFITGNHEYNTFVRGAGVELGPYLEDKLNSKGMETKFLGNAEGDIKLLTGCLIKNMHPDGGSSYAISYKTQKLIESLESGKKPNILNFGHFHKAEYLFYRNVHAFQTGTLEGQTKFMRGKQLAAHKGFWIVDVHSRQGGQVDKIVPQFFPAYR